MKNKTKKLIKSFFNNGIDLFVLSILTGIFAGAVVTIYNILVHIGEHTSLEYYAYLRANPWFIPLLFIVLAAGALVIGTLVKFVPMIRGSGIPQIEGAASGLVPFKWYTTMCAMFAASLACVFLGLSAGGEGPSLEMGGCAGDATGAILRRTQMVRRLQIAAGASAGLAVAFNAPITGLFFAMEEAFHSFSAKVFICAAISVVSSLFTRNLIRLALGYSVGYTFDNFVFAEVDYSSIVYFVIAAVVAALFGVIFYYSMLQTKKLFKKVTFLKGTGKYLIPFLAAGVFGLITPYAMGGGHDFIQSLATNGTGVFNIEQVFGWGIIVTLIIVVLFKFLAGIMAMGCGVPCGVFIPMLAVGAGIGAILASIFTAFGMDGQYVDYLVIICMAVFFTTIVKAPITGIIMVFELTGEFANFLPALLGITIGYLISEIFRMEPVYEKSLHGYLKEEKLLEKVEKQRVEVVVKKLSLADGDLIRNIIWPSNGLVVAIMGEDGSTFVPDGETELVAGQTLTFECDTADLDKLYSYLYEIVGKPDKK
ncbi:MAG: hypothetical protein E7370_04880 [Clostridiales bacterium]|nr:hypothetical protein [Clostridiales bacterium]